MNPEESVELHVPADIAVVSALLDGEEVEAVALKKALASEEVRDYFVDALVLRQAVASMGPQALVEPVRRRAMNRWAAAAVLLLCGLGGYALGARAGLVADVRGAQASIEAAADLGPPRAPQPTHVIRLEPGVTWHVEGGK